MMVPRRPLIPIYDPSEEGYVRACPGHLVIAWSSGVTKCCTTANNDVFYSDYAE